MSNCLPVKLTGCLIPHGKRQEEEEEEEGVWRIRGIMRMVGGVPFACSSTDSSGEQQWVQTDEQQKNN